MSYRVLKPETIVINLICLWLKPKIIYFSIQLIDYFFVLMDKSYGRIAIILYLNSPRHSLTAVDVHLHAFKPRLKKEFIYLSN